MNSTLTWSLISNSQLQWLAPICCITSPWNPLLRYALDYSASYAKLIFSQLIYAPQMILSLLTATAFYYHGGDSRIAIAGALHAFSWIAQFAGHGFAEKRAPALLDNLLGGKLYLSHPS